MLKEGTHRAINQNRDGIEWVCGDAQRLPLTRYRSMDLVTMAFGIRNVTDIRRRAAAIFSAC